jgi:hypothetical protein
MKSFKIVLNTDEIKDPKVIDAVSSFLDEVADANEREITMIQREMGVTNRYACAIWYLSTRSRWTQELEDTLINMCKDGIDCPNMNEWPE